MRSVHVRPTMHSLHGQKVAKEMTNKFLEFSKSCQTIFLCLEISGKGLWLFRSPTGASEVRIVESQESRGIGWFWSTVLLLESALCLSEQTNKQTYKQTQNQVNTKIFNAFLPMVSFQQI